MVDVQGEINNQIKFIIAIGGVSFSLAGFAFLWIIRIIKSQNQNSITAMKENNEIKNSIALQSKDIEYLKKENHGIQKKIEEMSTEIGILKLQSGENNTLLRETRKDIQLILEKLSRN